MHSKIITFFILTNDYSKIMIEYSQMLPHNNIVRQLIL